MRKLVLGLAMGLAWMWIGDAVASTFDEHTGRLDTTDAAFAFSFDSRQSLPAELTFMVAGENLRPLRPGEVEAGFVADENGLEGLGALAFGGTTVRAVVGLPDLTDSLAGRRVEVRVWQRPEGTRAIFELVYAAGADPMAGINLATIRFYPSGRATDDGWEEWTSGPIDYALGGVYGPSFLSVWDDQYLATLISIVENERPHFEQLRTRIDAFEIVDVGPASVPPSNCTVVDEDTACAPQGVCFYGRCTDAAQVLGPIPADPDMLDRYVDRRLFEWRSFEGGRRPQSKMDELEQRVRAARATGRSKDFWVAFGTGVEGLHDGHGNQPSMVFPRGSGVSTCVHLGLADLLPGEPSLPLVFSADGADLFAEQLEPGDAIAEIDGFAPEEWALLADRLLFYNGDPLGRWPVITRDLLGAAVMSGSELTVHRCHHDEGEELMPCTDDEVEVITFDLAELVAAPLWRGAPPSWLASFTEECDFRFHRAVDHPRVRDYSFAGYSQRNGIVNLLINGVPSYDEQGGVDWYEAVAQAYDPLPLAMILDQRMGYGGTITATDYVVAPMVEPGALVGGDMLPFFEDDYDTELRQVAEACDSFDEESCGGIYRWILGQSVDLPTEMGAGADVPLAILNSIDVSGNDFTSRFLTYRSGPTRIFGPGPTYGAFGPIYPLPGHIGEFMGGSVQAMDTVFLAAPDSATEYTTGYGVEPDEVVLQRQSDALAGVDTVLEAAEAWLREEVGP